MSLANSFIDSNCKISIQCSRCIIQSSRLLMCSRCTILCLLSYYRYIPWAKVAIIQREYLLGVIKQWPQHVLLSTAHCQGTRSTTYTYRQPYSWTGTVHVSTAHETSSFAYCTRAEEPAHSSPPAKILDEWIYTLHHGHVCLCNPWKPTTGVLTGAFSVD